MVNLLIKWKDQYDLEKKNLYIGGITWTNSEHDLIGYWLKDQPFLNSRFTHFHQTIGRSTTSLSIQHISYGRHIDFAVCHNDDFLIVRISLLDDGDAMVRVSSKCADGTYGERYYDEVNFDENMIIEIQTDQIVEYYDNTIIGFTRNL
jgi:hypothetical protein